jgi:hypothetical protein
MPETKSKPAWMSIGTAIAIPILLFVALVAWGFSSPVGSSPDDDFHLASIWCGLGDRPGLCEAASDPSARMVPAPIVHAPCFAFHAEVNDRCWNPSATGMVETKRVNTGLYPPVFYATMSIFASHDIQTSVLVMRSLNAALAVGLLTAAFWALPRRLRPALLVASIGASVPLGLFIVPSTNGSSWAYVSAAILWVCLFAATQTTGRRQIVLGVLALIGCLMGAGARADAAAYAVVAVVAAAIMGLRAKREVILPTIVGLVVTVAAAGFYLVSNQTSAITSGFTGSHQPGSAPLTSAQLISNFLGVPSLWTGALGGWGLGWLDTLMPAVVTTFSTAVFAGALFIGIRSVNLRRWIALGLVFTVMWLTPFAVLMQSHAVIGQLVQPRYTLPAMVLFLAVASSHPSTERWWRGARSYVAAVALFVGAALALHTNIRRYTTGINSTSTSAWWWTGVPAPTVVWVIGSVAFAAALLLIAFGVSRLWRVTPAPAVSNPQETPVPAAV